MAAVGFPTATNITTYFRCTGNLWKKVMHRYNEMKEQNQKDTKKFEDALWKMAAELEKIRGHLHWIVWTLWSGLALYIGVFLGRSF
jgi:hypothetical protein